MVCKLMEYVVIYILRLKQNAVPHPNMVPYARREHAKRRRDDARASGSIVRDEWERDDNSPTPHEVVEEEVFDDMVRNIFRDDHKGMDYNDMEQEHLYKASLTLVFEGCKFSICKQFMNGAMQVLTRY